MQSPHAHLAAPDAELAPLLAKLGPPAPDSDDVLVLREQFETVSLLHQAEWEDRAPPASTHRVYDRETRVEAEDGSAEGTTAVRCYAPTPGAAFPLLVWFHGGGFVAGSTDTDDGYLRSLCVDLQLAIVSVGYRLAPEHPFPTGFNDAYNGLKWAAAHAHTLNASPLHGFLVGGTSAGANLAASVTLRARDDAFFAPGSDREITGQLLQTPQVLHPDAPLGSNASELRSMEEQANAPFLTARKLRAFARALNAPPGDLRVSPLLAHDHARLPRAFVQVFGLDPLRDEGLMYARLLRNADVEVRTNVYPGYPHTFQMVFPETEAAHKVDRELRDGVRWLLDAKTNDDGSSGCLLS